MPFFSGRPSPGLSLLHKYVNLRFMPWSSNVVLIIPALDWYHCDPRLAERGEDWAAQTPRMPATLGWMLQHLRAYRVGATIGFFGESVGRFPDEIQTIAAAGLELAAMTYDAVDPWALLPGVLRDQVEKTLEAVRRLGLPAPTTFMPPFPKNQVLDQARETAMRETGIRRLVGCHGSSLPAIKLGEIVGWPLSGVYSRLAPGFTAQALIGAARPWAWCISTMDVDPGAPGCGPFRTRSMHRFPRLLRRGFIAARDARSG